MRDQLSAIIQHCRDDHWSSSNYLNKTKIKDAQWASLLFSVGIILISTGGLCAPLRSH